MSTNPQKLYEALEQAQDELDKAQSAARRAFSRVEELEEAIVLHENGMDPLLAKLRARTSIGDRYHAVISALTGGPFPHLQTSGKSRP